MELASGLTRLPGEVILKLTSEFLTIKRNGHFKCLFTNDIIGLTLVKEDPSSHVQ